MRPGEARRTAAGTAWGTEWTGIRGSRRPEGVLRSQTRPERENLLGGVPGSARSVRYAPTEVCPPVLGRPRLCLVDPQLELIESLSDSELSGVAEELQKKWAEKPQRDRERETATNAVANILQRTGPDGLREAVRLRLTKLPNVDLAQLVQRVREKG